MLHFIEEFLQEGAQIAIGFVQILFFLVQLIRNLIQICANSGQIPPLFLVRFGHGYRDLVSPDARILCPKIEPKRELHFYKTGNLCLYDWREQPWQDKWHLADTVIPWTAEWLLYYEIYLLTGKWLGKSAIHGEVTKVAEPQPNPENALAV